MWPYNVLDLLELKHQPSYLGRMINGTMQWSPHINNISTKASILSGVIWVIVRPQPDHPVPSYLSLVHPKIKYASCVWGPHEAVHIQALDKVQWRAARWVLSDYGRQSSITIMLTQLGWPTLQHRCFISRLILFYKIIHENVPLTIPFYFLSTQYPMTS